MLPCLTTSPHPMHRGVSGVIVVYLIVDLCGFVAYLIWPSSIVVHCLCGRPFPGMIGADCLLPPSVTWSAVTL